MGQFWVQNGPFAQNKHFLGKIIHIIFIYLLTNSIVPNLIFFFVFTIDPDYEDVSFLDPKWRVNLPKSQYFQKPVEKPSSYH